MTTRSGEVSLESIVAARLRLGNVVDRTPLDYSTTLTRLTGLHCYLKLENLQKTGSFKIRGSYNKIASLSEEEKARGVLAASAGNHAQGVACAAARAGIKATIVMPQNAPIAKIVATRAYGADVVLHGRGYDEAYQEAQRLKQASGATFIHAFDDPLIIAGQGTCALEILEQLPDVDAVVVPAGGGGLLAGISTVIRALRPRARIIGVQAAGAPAIYLSCREGVCRAAERAVSFADGICVRQPGELPVSIISRLADEIVLVEEEEIARAILILLERCKVVAEGAGAVGVAALLQGKVNLAPGSKVVVVVSGGNIDVNMLAVIIERGLVEAGRRLFLRTVLEDQPGQLQHLLALVAGLKGNIISVTHDRTTARVPLKQAAVELQVETRDAAHIEEIVGRLREQGYTIERVD